VADILGLVHYMALVTQTHFRNRDCQQGGLKKYRKRTQLSQSDGANLLSHQIDVRSS
jgi:hypothetical protein